MNNQTLMLGCLAGAVYAVASVVFLVINLRSQFSWRVIGLNGTGIVAGLAVSIGCFRAMNRATDK